MTDIEQGQWEQFTWSGDKSEDNKNLKNLPPVTPGTPAYSFNNIEVFAQRHRLGTETEFEYERLIIRRFNRAGHKFNAWPLIVLRSRGTEADVLFFVQPGSNDTLLPKEDEICGMNIPTYGLRLATRRENPCSSLKLRHEFWEHCLVFEVIIPYDTEQEGKVFRSIKPFFLGPWSAKETNPMPQPLSSVSKTVTFELRLSTSTKDAELTALSSLTTARESKTDGWFHRVHAFQYVMTFKDPKRHISLFNRFPHMRDPILNPKAVPPKLVERFRNLNANQIDAYKYLLSKIPEGVCVLPGGPGAGKTHFNLTVAAALLLKDEKAFPGEVSTKAHRNKVLFLLDINKPLTDIANKMHQLCGELGLTREESDGSEVPRLVIRMFCWSYEATSVRRGRLDAEREEFFRGDLHDGPGDQGKADGPLSRYEAEKDQSERITIHKFSAAFQRAEKTLEGCVAPTLDQAARIWYESRKQDKYTILRRMLDHKNPCSDNSLQEKIGQVYRDVLQAADVVVTTPVTASKFSIHMGSSFKPSLVVFDEAPHARELSTLIAIANFDPTAWLFTGDHEQTKPWVSSYGKRPAINSAVHQLRVSMMERAYVANPDMPSLLINHRAQGNLQMLGSKLFYGGKMVPAKDPDDLPPSTLHLRQKYIMPLKHNAGPEVSRLIVVLKGIGPAKEVQKSWYHPKHQLWTLDLVNKLLRDSQFLHTNGKDPGSILIMSPYKQAFLEYRKAIKELKKKAPYLANHVIEPRTVGTAQGHEADFVILDLVRPRITDHLEDPNRLCVSLTRAKQAEIILMHADMAAQLRMGQSSSGTLAKVLSFCEKAGECVYDPATLCPAGPSGVPAAAPRAKEDSKQPSESIKNPIDHCEADMRKLSLGRSTESGAGW